MNALGQMVGGIAHDFNNVLMPIMGLPKLLLSKPELLDNKNEVTSALEIILSAAIDAREIVRQLCEFYRPADALAVCPVTLQDLVHRAITITKPLWETQAQVGGRSIRIETALPADPVIVLANDSSLREVLTNLIINAVDAIPGDGTVTIGASQAGDEAVIWVADTGTGMPEEIWQHCFEPFFSTKGEHGTGLGLAVCYGIMQRHGGRIEVESEESKGTTFTIHLPRTPPQSKQIEPREADSLSGFSGTLRVLVIDDEEVSRALLSRYLASAGHLVETANSGRQAMQILSAGFFDLVITDRSMPGIGGDELAHAIKRTSPATPVLMLTGVGDLMNSKVEHPEGVDEILGKPVTQDELLQAIGSVMSRLKKQKGARDTAPQETNY